MTAYDYALLALEAYTSHPDIGAADSASRAIVRDTVTGLVIAFPGTDNHACFVADIDALTISVAGLGDVHRGFWGAWTAISASVADAIGERPVTFVGHSLGAALAILAGVTRHLAGKPVTGIYGFEPPHVSPHASIATALTQVPVYLTKNGNDMVPDVPLAWHHAVPLTQIGHATRPFPNVEDHSLSRVILALTPQLLP